MVDFKLAYERTARFEGGYVNDPEDPGGETNYGITVNEARAAGYQGPMKDIPLDLVKVIYRHNYWDAMGLDALEDQAVANEMYDTAVNCGVGVAARIAQRSMNLLNKMGALYRDVVVDGEFGPQSAAAMNACCHISPAMVKVLIALLNSLQVARYAEIAERNPRLERFVMGWIANRGMY